MFALDLADPAPAAAALQGEAPLPLPLSRLAVGLPCA